MEWIKLKKNKEYIVLVIFLIIAFIVLFCLIGIIGEILFVE